MYNIFRVINGMKSRDDKASAVIYLLFFFYFKCMYVGIQLN